MSRAVIWPLAIICGALGCTAASAQTSFSSVSLITKKPGQAALTRPYSTARFYSEDNQNYRFRAFGCDYSVQHPFQGTAYERAVLKEMRAALTGNYTIDLYARLVDGKIVGTAENRPNGISCDSSNLIVLFVARNQTTSVSALLQMNHPYNTSPIHWAVFPMKQDYFTPGQVKNGIQYAGSIADALLRAWITRGRR